MTSTDLYVRRLDGIDGSHYQPDAGPMDLGVVRAIPTEWLAWKATQSTRYVDPTFRKVRAQTDPMGFRHRPWYHWLSSTTNPITQADHYMNTVLPLKRGEGIMLDAEENGIDVSRCAVFLEEVEEETRRPSSVYSGLYVAGGAIWKSDKIRESAFGPRPMHLAAYVSRENLLARMKAQGVLHLPMHAWQYSSNGPVPGITGRCDMNTIVDRVPFDLSCGYSVAGPIIPVPTPPTHQEEDTLVIITNKEQFFDAAPGVMKFVLMDDGRLRHISPSEWAARGSNEGYQWMNSEIGNAGIWAPPVLTPTVFTGTLSGTVG